MFTKKHQLTLYSTTVTDESENCGKDARNSDIIKEKHDKRTTKSLVHNIRRTCREGMRQDFFLNKLNKLSNSSLNKFYHMKKSKTIKLKLNSEIGKSSPKYGVKK